MKFSCDVQSENNILLGLLKAIFATDSNSNTCFLSEIFGSFRLKLSFNFTRFKMAFHSK
jgi:hypothetical protein